MFETRCPQRCAPTRVSCGQDQRAASARAAAVAQAARQGGQCQDLFDSQVEVVVEPAVVTAPNIINHHRRVEHIVPIITEEVHQYHDNHEFVARPENRIRKTFDSNFMVGRPLTMQQTQMPEQLVPVEVDVIERFGLNQPYGGAGVMTQAPAGINQALNYGGFTGQQVQVAPVTTSINNSAYTQIPRQATFGSAFMGKTTQF